MHTHYSFSVTGKRIGTDELGVFISGVTLKRGSFELILPFKMGDFAPLWEREVASNQAGWAENARKLGRPVSAGRPP